MIFGHALGESNNAVIGQIANKVGESLPKAGRLHLFAIPLLNIQTLNIGHARRVSSVCVIFNLSQGGAFFDCDLFE